MCCFCCTSQPSVKFSHKESLLFIYVFIYFFNSLKISEINCKSYTLDIQSILVMWKDKSKLCSCYSLFKKKWCKNTLNTLKTEG